MEPPHGAPHGAPLWSPPWRRAAAPHRLHDRLDELFVAHHLSQVVDQLGIDSASVMLDLLPDLIEAKPVNNQCNLAFSLALLLV